MRIALINPSWNFDGSIYFGCRQPHLPLELGYAKALLEKAGHEALIIDGHAEHLSLESMADKVRRFRPAYTVVTTAPSYLFWRCAPPELRIPQETIMAVCDHAGRIIVVGPHGSTSPRSTIRKLQPDILIMGECEDMIGPVVDAGPEGWANLDSVAYPQNDEIKIQGGPHATDLELLPALSWADGLVRGHYHHHHRFDMEPAGPGAEVEYSRGCPYSCTFCAKENFRNAYRKRPLAVVLEEIDGLIDQGVEYIYFIDELFLPDRPLLEALSERRVLFGIQTRIDLWPMAMLDLLGEAGCLSVEAGVESITVRGREMLDTHCRLTTDEISDRLIHAKKSIRFVQANLLQLDQDNPDLIEHWRQNLQHHGVWANMPVPLFPYPGSPDYVRRWGLPDDQAWERAVEHYLKTVDEFSDSQEGRPLPLSQLELPLQDERQIA